MPAHPRIGLAALAMLGLLAATAHAAAQEDDDAPAVDDVPHITTLGTASVAVAPDSAEVRLGVAIVKPSAAEAWDATGKAAQALVDAAKGAGVAEPDIASANIGLGEQVEFVRQPDGSNRQISNGYRASHDFVVRVRDLTRIGSLTQLLIEKGANSFGGISFHLSRSTELRETLAADALRSARKTAEALAAAEKVKLGRLLKVEPPEQVRYSATPGVFHFESGATMPLAPGTETLSQQVEATWAIE